MFNKNLKIFTSSIALFLFTLFLFTSNNNWTSVYAQESAYAAKTLSYIRNTRNRMYDDPSIYFKGITLKDYVTQKGLSKEEYVNNIYYDTQVEASALRRAKETANHGQINHTSDGVNPPTFPDSTAWGENLAWGTGIDGSFKGWIDSEEQALKNAKGHFNADNGHLYQILNTDNVVFGYSETTGHSVYGRVSALALSMVAPGNIDLDIAKISNNPAEIPENTNSTENLADKENLVTKDNEQEENLSENSNNTHTPSEAGINQNSQNNNTKKENTKRENTKQINDTAYSNNDYQDSPIISISKTINTPINYDSYEKLSFGKWENVSAKWRFNKAGKYLKNTWAYLNNNNKTVWYAFDENSVMITGWYKNKHNDWYYLSEEKTDKEGQMQVSWKWIKSKDGKERCYYFKENGADAGKLLTNTIIDNKYQVNENGAWVIKGVEQVR